MCEIDPWSSNATSYARRLSILTIIHEWSWFTTSTSHPQYNFWTRTSSATWTEFISLGLSIPSARSLNSSNRMSGGYPWEKEAFQPDPDPGTVVKKSQLCNLCKDLVDKAETTWTVTYVRYFEATNSSAASECQLCSLCYYEISEELHRHPEIIIDGNFSFEVVPDAQVHKIYVVCKDKCCKKWHAQW